MNDQYDNMNYIFCLSKISLENALLEMKKYLYNFVTVIPSTSTFSSRLIRESNMFTCIAIDDEFSALEILTDYIAEQPQLKLLKTYSNPLTALTAIEKLAKSVDIIFLDIEMPNMSGLELAKLIKHKCSKLIFTTAHANYAYNSYELEADGFLLKPILPSTFAKAIKNLFKSQVNYVQEDINKYILVKSTERRNQIIKINLSDIIAIEAQERSSKIYADRGIILSNSSLNELLKLLEGTKGFSQIHRSFIVAENRIKILEHSYIILNNDLKISIGRKYSAFYQKMSNNR